MLNKHLQLTTFIHIEDFQNIRINGPFELLLLSPQACQLKGQGYLLSIEAGDIRIASMNIEEVTITVQNIVRLDLKKMDLD